MQHRHSAAQETKNTLLPIQTVEATPADVTPINHNTEAPTHIAKLIKRLRRRSPVRKIAEGLLQSQPPQTIAPMLAALSNPSDSRWKERTVAAWALGQVPLTEEQKTEIVQVLCDVLTKKHRVGALRLTRLCRLVGRSLVASSALIGMLLLAVMVPSFGLGIRTDLQVAPPWLDLLAIFCLGSIGGLLLVTPFMTPISLAFDLERANNVRFEVASTLGCLHDVRSIAALAAIMHDRNPGFRSVAEATLRQILPLLTSEHYGQLSAQTVPNLCRLLAHQDNEFVLLILDALDKIGNGSAVSAVEDLAQKGPTNAIRKAAAQTLAILKERHQQEQNEQNLLRASQASSPETLLRPVNAEVVTDPQQLLRGAEQPSVKIEDG